MTKIRRLLTLALAACMALTMTACSTSDTSWVIQYGDEKVPAGVYLYYLSSAYQNASYQVEDTQKDVLKQQVEGKDAAEWIEETAAKSLLSYAAVEQEFQNLGLTLEESAQNYAATQTDQFWANYGADYENSGISKDSFLKVVLNQEKRLAIFDAYYAEGGSEEVPTADIRAYFNENFAKVKYVSLSVPYAPGKTTPADEEMETLREKANGYLERIKGGEGIDVIIDEYLKESNSSSLGNTDTEDGEKDPDRNVYYLEMSEETRDEEIVKQAFAMRYETPVLFESDNRIYIMERYDQSRDSDEDFAYFQASLLQKMKQEEFTQKLEDLTAAMTVTRNEDAFKRYTAKSVA